MPENVVKLTEKWADAEENGDVNTLRDLLTDDFVGIGPLGFTLSKEQWLQRYQSGSLRYTSYTVSELQPRIYGDAAVVVGVMQQDGTVDGRPIPGKFRATHVFVQQDGAWRAAGWHVSPLGPAGFPGGPGGPGGSGAPGGPQ